MAKTKITNDEKELLKQYLKTSSLNLIRLKSQTILLASKHMSDEDIADILDRKPRTIAEWRREWYRIRFASIFTGHKDNINAAKLTKEQKLTLARALSNPPSEYGLPKEFWDVPQLKTYVKATFDVVYKSDRTYRFLLTFSNLSFKYPDTFDLKRNESLILERMAVIRQEIAPLLISQDWEVFAADEVRMDQEAVIRKCWLKKGKRTIVKVDRKKQSQSYIGFLNQKNFKCHLYEMPWQNSDEVLKAVRQFLKDYPNKKICIVWDNAPFHKSKAIREQLKAGGIMERVHLIAMPPYAPDENPIEHIWNTTKQHVSNIQQNTFQETKAAFSDFVANRSFRYSF
jgi:transposase